MARFRAIHGLGRRAVDRPASLPFCTSTGRLCRLCRIYWSGPKLRGKNSLVGGGTESAWRLNAVSYEARKLDGHSAMRCEPPDAFARMCISIALTPNSRVERPVATSREIFSYSRNVSIDERHIRPSAPNAAGRRSTALISSCDTITAKRTLPCPGGMASHALGR